MKDEIKEILDNFKDYELRYTQCNENQFIIFYRDIHILLEYITNLQEENEKLNEYLNTSIKICNDRQKEIVRLNIIINKLEKELDRGYRDLFDMELVNGRELIINIKNYIDELKENNKDIYIEERYDSED